MHDLTEHLHKIISMNQKQAECADKIITEYLTEKAKMFKGMSPSFCEDILGLTKKGIEEVETETSDLKIAELIGKVNELTRAVNALYERER